jgi:plastocyanin
MRATRRAAGTVAVALLLAACSGNPPAATAGGPDSTQASVCTQASGTAAQVDATVSGNKWGPVSAKVGDVITWTNADAVPHKVALDDGSCTMANNITGDAQQSLVFDQAGSFPFHCTVHPSMKGTITIS